MHPLRVLWNDHVCTITGAEPEHQYSTRVLVLAAVAHLVWFCWMLTVVV